MRFRASFLSMKRELYSRRRGTKPWLNTVLRHRVQCTFYHNSAVHSVSHIQENEPNFRVVLIDSQLFDVSIPQRSLADNEGELYRLVSRLFFLE